MPCARVKTRLSSAAPISNLMRGVIIATAGLALVAACAGDPVRAPPPSVGLDSPLASACGFAWPPMGRAVVVGAVRSDRAAARAHLQPGDRILRLDGAQLTDVT